MQFLCKEKPQDVVRTVRLMSRTYEHVMEVIAKLLTVNNFLRPPEEIQNQFFNTANTLFEVDDVGVILVESYPAVNYVHITFWDRRLRGREELCKELEKMVRQLTGKMTVTVIPAHLTVVIAFAKRIGFVEHYRDLDGYVYLKIPYYPE